MTNCKKYLGLPMVGGKSKVSTFREIQERVTKRVLKWKEKHISKVGREVLIFLPKKKRSVDQNSSTSNTNLLYEHVQVPTKNL